jgi:hypothetical protein
MIHRIMLAAALLAVPAIVVAEQPARVNTTHAQQADTSKGKAAATTAKKKKKAAKKTAAKPAAKPAAKDTTKAK